ncbi:Ureide permease 1 [Sesamum alatum]|uniref:Ureide permease 1 n=1 Tax=Sesamum alatum TaxID=300844 RepID=A0AAE1YH37_9LAMI|nr:Ureide permease 1 [Sesamum alatum]
MDAQQQQRAAPPPPRPPAGGGGGGDFSAIFTVLFMFLAIAAMIIVPSSSNLKQSLSILHQVPEGHVGVYWRGGALLKTITDPGFHLKLPLITHFETIQVTLQTDLVRDIPCGTKGGVMINFEKIEIDEKMKDALQIDCTRYAPGIEIISVRVTKPTIPDSIKRNFVQMEEERTKVLIAMEKQRVSEKEAETQKKIAISEAEKHAHVSKIQMEQKLMEKDSARRQEEISNAMYLAREKSLADADYYRTMKEAEANKLKLTPQYLELKFIEAIANNSKIYFGNKVPNMVLDQRLLGNFLEDIVIFLEHFSPLLLSSFCKSGAEYEVRRRVSADVDQESLVVRVKLGIAACGLFPSSDFLHCFCLVAFSTENRIIYFPVYSFSIVMDYFGISTVLSVPSERIVFSGLKMYVVESKGGAIACMLLALLFLGTWPAILILLERRGRLPQHTYLDYTITNLLAAVIIAFTFGEIGKSTTEKPSFVAQLSQDNWPSVLFAMVGGIVLSLGNLATQYAWAFVGLSVTEVITASITVVIGTTLNYFLDDKINKAEILFPGVGCFLIAVCFGSAVHSSNAADNEAKLTSFSNDSKARAQGIKDASVSKETYANKDLENGTAKKEKAEFGTANFLIELENKRAIKVFGKGTFIGLAITFFAGVCFSLFSPAFNLATNDQWGALKDGVPHLSVYTAFFYFSVSCFVIAIILNISFLYWPVLNLPKSSFKAYLSDWNGRGWALLAGLLCGFGNGLQFMGGQAAGYAAADAVQALPLVSTFWGILLFGEYRRSSRRTYILLVGMLLMFIIAVGLLMASSGHRK